MVHAKNSFSDLETSVCGIVREPLAFWQFPRAAGTPDARRIRSIRSRRFQTVADFLAR